MIERTHDQRSPKEEVLKRIFELWDDSASQTAADAVLDMFADYTDDIEQLLGPLLQASPYWLEQIARAIVGLPSHHTEDFELLLELLKLHENEDDSVNFVFEQPVEDRIAAFHDWIDSVQKSSAVAISGRNVPLAAILASLEECDDALPDLYCDSLEVERGSTYSTAVQGLVAIAA